MWVPGSSASPGIATVALPWLSTSAVPMTSEPFVTVTVPVAAVVEDTVTSTAPSVP